MIAARRHALDSAVLGTGCIALLVLFALGGCSFSSRGGYFEDDGPGRTAPDVAKIPDAVPKNEARAARGNARYEVYGKSYLPLADARGYRERGIASWYGKKFHGRLTSSGESYDMYAMTAAHRTLPLPSYLRVRNLQNNRAVIVRVNDRGPFLNDRLIDLSYAAATKLGIVGTGTGLVEVEVVMPGEDAPIQTARAATPQPAAQAPSIELRGLGPIAAANAAPLPPLPGAASTSPAPAQPAASGGAAKLFVQVGAFRDWDNAAGMRARLERSAIGPVVVQPVLTDNNTRVYRVRVGPLASVEEGDRLSATLARQGVSNVHLVVE